MEQAVGGTLRLYGSTDLPVTQREQSAHYKPVVITGRYMSYCCAQKGPIVSFARAAVFIAHTLDIL